MIETTIYVFLLFLILAMGEIIKYDDMILSFGRYVIFSLFAIFLLGATAYEIAEGMFHPILLALIGICVALLIQSYEPVKEGMTSCYHSSKKWLKERFYDH